MSMIRYEPWSLMTQLHNEMNRLFERTPDESAQAATDWVPTVDIKEEVERFVIRADIPGVDPKDIEVTMEDGVLTLRGERRDESREAHEGWRRVERVSGRFFRRFTLPDTADAEGVSAHGAHGVLEIVIPKHARVQPKRITVKAA
ncbi:MAG TPA: Hsp20/alpha crystallin family protein [Gammaproteobacteria bacterium]|nr:Hsp20/alpha crystallin family protein [Gammaproteobacteria bacterium]